MHKWRTLSFAANDLHRGHGFAAQDRPFSRDFRDSDVRDRDAAGPIVSGIAWPGVYAVSRITDGRTFSQARSDSKGRDIIDPRRILDAANSVRTSVVESPVLIPFRLHFPSSALST